MFASQGTAVSAWPSAVNSSNDPTSGWLAMSANASRGNTLADQHARDTLEFRAQLQSKLEQAATEAKSIGPCRIMLDNDPLMLGDLPVGCYQGQLCVFEETMRTASGPAPKFIKIASPDLITSIQIQSFPVCPNRNKDQTLNYPEIALKPVRAYENVEAFNKAFKDFATPFLKTVVAAAPLYAGLLTAGMGGTFAGAISSVVGAVVFEATAYQLHKANGRVLILAPAASFYVAKFGAELLCQKIIPEHANSLVFSSPTTAMVAMMGSLGMTFLALSSFRRYVSDNQPAKFDI